MPLALRRTLLSLLTLGLLACGGGEGMEGPALVDPAGFVVVEMGTLPVVISVPHGGAASLPEVPELPWGSGVVEVETLELARAIQSELQARTGQRARLVASLASRKQVDPDRPARDAYHHPLAGAVYARYHEALAAAVQTARSQSPEGALLLDLHGQSSEVGAVLRQTGNGHSADLERLLGPGGFLAALSGSGVILTPSQPRGPEPAEPESGYLLEMFGLGSTGGIQAVHLAFGMSLRATPKARDAVAARAAQAILVHLRTHAPGVKLAEAPLPTARRRTPPTGA